MIYTKTAREGGMVRVGGERGRRRESKGRKYVIPLDMSKMRALQMLTFKSQKKHDEPHYMSVFAY